MGQSWVIPMTYAVSDKPKVTKRFLFDAQSITLEQGSKQLGRIIWIGQSQYLDLKFETRNCIPIGHFKLCKPRVANPS